MAFRVTEYLLQQLFSQLCKDGVRVEVSSELEQRTRAPVLLIDEVLHIFSGAQEWEHNLIIVIKPYQGLVRIDLLLELVRSFVLVLEVIFGPLSLVLTHNVDKSTHNSSSSSSTIREAYMHFSQSK